jgi:hypothetical protein
MMADTDLASIRFALTPEAKPDTEPEKVAAVEEPVAIEQPVAT